jgi:hypothetical protein
LFDCPCGVGDFALPGYPYLYCRGCGTRYEARWPPQEEWQAAESLLQARPRENQHWRRHEGETLDALRAENEAAGL